MPRRAVIHQCPCLAYRCPFTIRGDGISVPFVDPALNAADADVFWTEDASSFVLATAASEPTPATGCLILDLRRLRCRTMVLPSMGGGQHVLFRDGARRLQLAMMGQSLGRPVCLAAVVPSARMTLTRRVHLWRALEHLLVRHDLPARILRPESGAHRLLFILLAFDGWRTRQPLRETALILFGEKRVNADWDGNGRALRAQIQRAVSRGRWLVAGGYRALLR